MDKKILVLCPVQFGYQTDYYNYCMYLNNKYNITYIGIDNGQPQIEVKGVQQINIQLSQSLKFPILSYIRFVICYISSRQFDLIFVSYFKLCSIVRLFSLRTKSILDIRTGDLSESDNLRRIKNFLIRFASFGFCRVTVISSCLLKKLNLPIQKSSVLPLGANTIENDKEFFNINMLYVGRLEKRRIEDTIIGMRLFLDVFPSVASSIKYTIVGFGSDKTEQIIKKAILENKLDKQINFVGRVPYTEVHEYLEVANVGVAYVPKHEYYECQPPTKLFEYILAGMVTIATSTKENMLVVKPENGIVINDTPEGFYNGLVHVYKNRAAYKSVKIRETVKGSEWSTICNNLGEYLDLYLQS